MEARRRVKFTGGAELTASVEKVAIGLVEKAMASRHAGEGCGRREAQWRGRKTGCRIWVRWKYWPVVRTRDGEGGAVETTVAEAARWSVVAALR
jgi:hypothetical protein